ncbi:MAG TPA: cytochrome P450 [Burkholderiaceae bacterium]|nr:cytochrome P450 [Burkholderiaceae bacterium]
MRALSTEAASPQAGPITEASLRYDPFSAQYLADPFPMLASLRQSEPVFFSPDLGTWVVTRGPTIKRVLADSARFSALIVSDPLKPLCPHARQVIERSEYDVPPMLVNNDPPSHARYRKFFAQPLQRARLLSLQPFIERTVDEYLDRMLDRGPPADLLAALTWEVPALVIFELLGVPRSDVATIKRWADSRLVMSWGRPTDDEQVRQATNAVEFFRYAKALVQDRVERPGDDYVSDLIRLRDGDDATMSLHEISGTVFNLLFAGHETTTNAATNLFRHLLPDRTLWDRICRGEQPIAPVVEEGLRFDPPVHAWRRRAKVDVELDGIAIPAGGRLLLVFAAGNHDPEMFPDPERFDPDRKNAAQHMTFGFGAHYCMGAPLARQEVELMVAGVARRIPAIRLADGQRFDYVPNTAMHALRALHVTW